MMSKFLKQIEKYSSGELIILRLKEMLPTYEYFNLIPIEISEDTIRYFRRNVMDKSETDNLNDIRFDHIINKTNVYTLSLKYLEPLYVIEDIINEKYHKPTGIIYSKKYSLKEISVLLKISHSKLRDNKIIDGLYLNKYRRSNGNTLFVLGKDVVDKLPDIKKVISEKKIYNGKQTILKAGDKKEYIDIHHVAHILDVNYTWLRTRMRAGDDVFGVNFNNLYTTSQGTQKLFPLEDVEIAKANKVNYIERDVLNKQRSQKTFIKTKTSYLLRILGISSKDLKLKYIKKEIAIKIYELDREIEKENTWLKVVSIAKHILEENYNKYIDFIAFKSIFPPGYIKTTGTSIYGISINLNKCAKNNSISTKTALNVINNIVK